jgi:HK97 family phage major capsid protein
VIVVPTAIITSSGAEDRALLGDLSRSVLVYRRQGIVAESSRDAEFSLDNWLFRFGWRFDVAVVEPNQIRRFGTP